MSRMHVMALTLVVAALVGLPLVAWFFPIQPPPSELIGTVRANDPIADATVRIRGTTVATRTDGAGQFHLPRPADPSRITAAKEGYFIAGIDADARPLSLGLKRLPATDNETYAWVDPAAGSGTHNCGNCHPAIYEEWSASAHARSATGKHLINLYDGSDWHGRANVGWSLLRDRPDGAGVCNACHAPTKPFDGEGYFDLRNAKGVAAQGVHCDYCHKIEGVGDGPLGQTHGRFNLGLLRPSHGQLFFGPLDDVDRGDDSPNALYRDSRYCASCHEGTVFGVPVYTTYSEWQASPARRAGKQCQTCHMAPTGRLSNFAPGHGGMDRDPKTLANHRFFATSQEEMLRQAVALSAELRRDGDGVRAEIEVRADGAGHRLPTGFIDRHLLLVVEALGSDGQSLPLNSGPTLPAVAGRALAGRPGKLYAKLLKDFDGRSPAPFWQADPAPADSRLTPGVPDRLTFAFAEGAKRLRVRVLYRRFWQQVAEEKGWPDQDIVVADRTIQLAP